MNQRITLLFLIICLVLPLSISHAQDTLYWVGGSGNWTDLSRWATTSGGNIHPSQFPASAYTPTVIFDSNSFTGPNQNVIIDNVFAACLNMDWSTAKYNPTLEGGFGITIFGSLHYIDSMKVDYDGITTFVSDSLGNTIHMAKNIMKNVTFEGSGSWRLTSDMGVAAYLTFNKGTLYTDGYDISCGWFVSTPSNPFNIRNIYLEGNTVFTVANANVLPYLSWNIDNSAGSVKIYPSGSTLIRFLGGNGLYTMRAGANLLYDDIQFLGTGRLEHQEDTIRDVSFGGVGTVIGDSSIFRDITYGNVGYFTGNYNNVNDINGYNDCYINGNHNNYRDVVIYRFGFIGNAQLTGWNVNNNTFRDVEIYRQGRIYGDTLLFRYVNLSTQPAPCGCTCSCCETDDSEVHGSYITAVRVIFHNRNGLMHTSHGKADFLSFSCCNGTIDGHSNVFDTLYFYGDGNILNGSNQFDQVYLQRNTHIVCPLTSYYVHNTLTLQKDSLQTIGDILTLFGPYACNHTVIRSTQRGYPAYMYTGSVLALDYIELYDIHASNGIGVPDTAFRSLDSLGNANWLFLTPYLELVIDTFSALNQPCWYSSSGSITLHGDGGVPPYQYSREIYNFPYWSAWQDDSTFSPLPVGSYNFRITDSYGCLAYATGAITAPPPIQPDSVVAKGVTCFGNTDGTLFFSAKGGTPPYSYLWSTGDTTSLVQHLPPGIYSLTVTDAAGCFRVFADTVIEPALFSTNFGGGHIVIDCHGDSTAIILNLPSGGTPPFTYYYVPQVTLYSSDTIVVQTDTAYVHAGSYLSYGIDNNGCISQPTYVQRFEPPPIKIDLLAGINNCNDSTGYFINSSVSGGNGFGYQYLWSNAATTAAISGLSPGKYFLTVTDFKGCVGIDSISIEPLSVQITATNVKCYGGSSGSAGAQSFGVNQPHTFLWSTGSINSYLPNIPLGVYYVTVTDAIGCQAFDSVEIMQPDSALALVLESINTSCRGVDDGQAMVYPSGGTPPYRYMWSSTDTTQAISGKSPGSYSVTVTDSAYCVAQGTVTISEPPPGMLTFKTGNFSCAINDHWAAVTASGGTPPFTYSWSNGQSADTAIFLTPGTYQVLAIDANGCEFSGSVDIVALNLSHTYKDVSCFGGSDAWIQASVTGGNQPYTYAWVKLPAIPLAATSHRIDSLTPGDYAMAVTDSNGCILYDTIIISQPSQALQLTMSQQNIKCYGGSNGFVSTVIGLQTGTFPYTHRWSTGLVEVGFNSQITGLPAGTYADTVVDANGCVLIGSVTLTQPPQISFDIVQQNHSCAYTTDGTIAINNVVGGTGGWQYSLGASFPYSSQIFYTSLPDGTYTITVRDDTGCISPPQTVTILKPAPLKISFTGNGPTQFGGSDGNLTALVSGGTPPYLHHWNTGSTSPALINLSQGCYTDTIRDANGCILVKDTCLQEPSLMLLNLSKQDVTCFNAGDGVVTASVTGGVPPYTFTWSNGVNATSNTSHSINNLSPGMYAVTVTDQNNIVRIQNIQVFQPDLLQVSFSYSDSICDGTSVGWIKAHVVGGTQPFTYQWSNGGIMDSISGLTSGTYRLTVTDHFGCSLADSIRIDNYPLPVADYMADTACLGNPTSFINLSYAFNGKQVMEAYWHYGDGMMDTLYSPIISGQYYYGIDGIYTASLQVMDENGCYSPSVSKVVVVKPIPTPQFLFDTACFGNPNHFVDISFSSAGILTKRLWQFGNGDTAAVINPSYIFNSHGQHPVKLIVEDNIGCKDSITHIITVDSLPLPDFNYANNYCPAGSVSFIDLAQPNGSQIVMWKWDFGSYQSSLQNPDYIFPATDTFYTVQLAVGSERGCADSIVKSVYVAPGFDADFTADTACLGSPTSFNSIIITPANDTILVWLWDFGDGNYSSLPNPTHIYSYPGSYNVILSVLDQHFCEKTIIKKVVVRNLTQVDFSYQFGCTVDPVTFYGMPGMDTTSISSYLWDFGDPSAPGGSIATTRNAQHAFSSDSTFVITFSITDTNSCQNSISKSLQIPMPFDVQIQSDTVCFGQFTPFSANANRPIKSWSWEFGEPSSFPYNLSNLSAPTHKYLTHGNFLVRLIATDSAGCIDTAYTSVFVAPLPQAGFSFDIVCEGSSTLFYDTSSSTNGSIISWQWDFGDGITSSMQNPTHIYPNTGTYYSTLIVTDVLGCQNATSRPVLVYPTPNAGFVHDTACVGQPVFFLGYATTAVKNWQWSFGDGGYSTTPSATTYVYNNPGVYTLTLIVETYNGCFDTVSGPVYVYPLPVPAFMADTVCVGTATSFVNLSYAPSGGNITHCRWDFGDGTTSFDFNPLPHVYPGAGIYYVTLEVTTSTGCTQVISKPVRVNPQAYVSISYNSVCQSDPVNFFSFSSGYNQPGVQWYWEFGDGSTSTAQHPVYTYAQAGYYLVRLSVTDMQGCVSTAEDTIQIFPPPAVFYTYLPATCTNDTVYFTNLSYSGAGIFYRQWNFDDPLSLGNNISYVDNPKHLFTATGNYMVRLYVVDSNYCQAEYTGIVPYTKNPAASFAFDRDSICFFDSVNLSDSSDGGGYAIVYRKWDFGDGQSVVNIANPTHLYTSPGLYYVQLLIRNSVGCEDSVRLSVYVAPLPQPVFTVDSICFGNLSHMDAAPAADSTSWLWRFGDGKDTLIYATNPSISHLYDNPGSYTITLIATTQLGCIDSSVRVHVVYPAPIAGFIVDTVCRGEATTFLDQSIYTVPVIKRYWSFGDGKDTTSLTPPKHVYAQAGTYLSTLIIEDINGCSDTATVSVLVHSLPFASFIADTICLGDTMNFYQTSHTSNGLIQNWEWYFGDPLSGNDDTSFLTNPYHWYDTSGVFYVSLVVTDSAGCKSVVTNPVIVNPLPIVNFTASQACYSDSVYFTDLSYSIGSSLISWHWEFGDGSGSNLQHPVHVYPDDSTYLVVLRVSDSNQCMNEITKPVFIDPLPVAAFGYTAACQGKAVYFSDSSYVDGGSIVSWHWDFGDGSTSVAQNPVKYYYSSGTYHVRLVVLGYNGCSDTMVHQVEIYPLPAMVFWADSVCQGNPTQFYNYSYSASGIDTSKTYWEFGDILPVNNYSFNWSPSHQYFTSGNFIVTLYLEDSNGCVNLDTLSVVVYANPIADFDYAQTCFGHETDFTDMSLSLGSPISSWAWEFGNPVQGVSSQADPQFTFNYWGNHYVQLVVEDFNACRDTAGAFVLIDSLPIPDFTYRDTCTPGLIYFTDLTSGNGLTITQWLWNFEASYFSTNQHPHYTFLKDDTTYMVELIVTDSKGCQDSITKAVSLHPAVRVEILADTACFNSPTTFSYQYLSKDTLLWLEWSFGDGNTSAVHAPMHTYGAPGYYDVFLTYADTNGCIYEAFRKVYVYTLPDVHYSMSMDTLCFGTALEFIDQTTFLDGGIDSVFWDFGDGSYLSFQGITPYPLHHTYGAAGNYHVVLQVLDSNGCMNSYDEYVVVLQVPVIDFVFDTVCFGMPTQFVSTNSPAPGNLTWWYWDFGDGNDTFNIQNPAHVYSSAGTHLARLKVENVYGCSDTVEHLVFVRPNPSASYLVSTTCFGDTTQFINTSTLGSGALLGSTWYFGDPVTGTNDTSLMTNPSHLYSSPGLFYPNLIVLDTYGCLGVFLDTLEILPAPVPNFSALTACKGDTVYFTDQSYTTSGYLIQWRWDFGDGTYSTDQHPVHVYPGDSTYWVTLEVSTNSSCTREITKPIFIDPLPVAAFGYTAACQGKAVYFTDSSYVDGGNIVSWHWDFGDGSTSLAQNPVKYYYTSGPFTVKLTVKGFNGCIDSIITQVVVYDRPVISISADTVCQGHITQFSNMSYSLIGIDTAKTYWTFGDLLPVNNFSFDWEPGHMYQGYGNFKVSLYIEDSMGCFNIDTLQVLVRANPIAVFDYTQTCFKQNTYFDDLSLTLGGPIATWHWDFGNPVQGTSSEPDTHFRFNHWGHHYTQLIVNDIYGCADTAGAFVFIDSLPIPNFSWSDSCMNGWVNFHNLSNPNGYIIDSFYWYFDALYSSNLEHPYHVFNQSDTTYLVSLVAVTHVGCADTITYPVYIDSSLSVSFFVQHTCFGDSTEFTPVFSPGSTNFSSFFWDFGDNTTAVGSNPLHVYASPGQYIVKLRHTRANGCIDSLFRIVEIKPLPIPHFGYYPNPCDSTIQLTDSSYSANGYIGTWFWTVNNISTYLFNAPASPNMALQYDSLFQHDITLRVTDSFGCINSSTQTIQWPVCVKAHFVVDTGNHCEGESYCFIDSTTATSQIIEWKWVFGGTDSLIYQSVQNPVCHRFTVNGWVDVVLSVISMQNGKYYYDTASHTIWVNPKPVAAFSADSVCQGNLTSFNDESTIDYGNIIHWDWNFNDGNGGSSSLQHPIHVYPSWGNYPARLIIVSDSGCSDTLSKTVVIHPLPVPNLIIPEIICDTPANLVITDLSFIDAGQIVQWNWDFGDNSMLSYSSYQPSVSHSYLDYGTYLITLELLSDKGCMMDTVASHTLAVTRPPVSRFSPNPRLEDALQAMIYFFDESYAREGNLYEWNWVFGDGAKESLYGMGSGTTSHLYADSGFFNVVLMVTDDNGCADTSDQVIRIYAKTALFIPNAFTPTKRDGINDYFLPKGSYFEDNEFSMEIYDRQGMLMFRTNVYKAWDGRVYPSGEMAPVGVYVYKIRVKDTFGIMRDYVGHVTLVR